MAKQVGCYLVGAAGWWSSLSTKMEDCLSIKPAERKAELRCGERQIPKDIELLDPAIPKPSFPVSTTLEILFLLFYEAKSNPISDTDHPIVDNERWIFKLDIFRCSCKIVGKRSHSLTAPCDLSGHSSKTALHADHLGFFFSLLMILVGVTNFFCITGHLLEGSLCLSQKHDKIHHRVWKRSKSFY